ncbi:MAG: metallophosphoesterase [Oscillospiraceae bacterium]|nr:metallophosphoesterase [Oscillospiraceae bacterium]
MAEKGYSGREGKKWLRVLLTVVCCLAGIFLLIYAVNFCCSLSLRSYIRSLEPVAYDSAPLVPVYDEALGHYVVKTDRDLKVMMLSDIHIGGGAWSVKQDRKTVYEVAVMLRKEKPDFVILGGDNTFAVPGPVFRGGGTLDNAMVARDILELFEHEGVYFTTVFGNHDTEAFGYVGRKGIGKLYESDRYPHCLFVSEFSDPDSARPSVSNQIIAVENSDGSLARLILLMDTHDYIDGSLDATINWKYDAIHPAQTEWARQEIVSLSEKAGLTGGDVLRTICFFHIPIGEYETAYRELEANGFADTLDSEYVEGVWDEELDSDLGGRIWYGGCYRKEDPPGSIDGFFEALGPDGIGSLEACFCGHDHVNDAIVRYRGVLLGYNRSVDNLAYSGIAGYGSQRGCTVFTLRDGGEWSYELKNVYIDCGADPEAFFHVELNTPLYPNPVP